MELKLRRHPQEDLRFHTAGVETLDAGESRRAAAETRLQKTGFHSNWRSKTASSGLTFMALTNYIENTKKVGAKEIKIKGYKMLFCWCFFSPWFS